MAPYEGTSYEIGGIALVKGARNAAKADSLQSPANRTFQPDPRIPSMDSVRLIKYDFEKYGKSADRRRLLERWNKVVGSLSK